MDTVKHILQEHFHIADWTISRPKDGMQKACYVVQSGAQKVFVKFDVPIEPLQRLGEIEVAPRVLASGIVEGRSYVVKEYITGRYPDWRWFAEHLPTLAKYLQAVELVPIQADPNIKNILLVSDGLLMVDWDDIRLSDPMQDVGLLLWWYVAKAQWPEFFKGYGLPLDEQVEDRIFWWAARTSLMIALWHVAHSFECEPFLKDFMAAVRKKSNSHTFFH